MKSSLASRAVMAIALLIGFYLLALIIAGALLYIPYAEIAYAHRIHIKLALICVVAALAILWSVLPRLDRFEAPGPRLTKDQHPRLFKEVESIAGAVRQEMPAEVYVVPDVNAWVAQRGGVMGFGSRRVMGLGLPLMRVLTCSQVRAVLAHEFGHYHGGDTRLGPWIYKTRAAIGRTINALSGEDGNGSLLQMPFLAYGKMFLRVTHAISRRQEFVADELAARTVGSKPLSDGLRVINGVAPAYEFYMSRECAPVLNAGYRPPLMQGFQKFVQAERISNLMQKQLEEELASGKTDPYDTHPPLRERIAAVQHLPPGGAFAEDPPAITLLEDPDGLERELLASMAGAETAGKLQPITWEEVCERVYVPGWRKLVTPNANALSGLTPESLPRVAADLKSLGVRLVNPGGEKVPAEEAEGFAGAVLGAALALQLLQRGGKLETAPGEDVTLALGTEKIAPFGVAHRLQQRELTPEAWEAQSRVLGITGCDLGKVAPQTETFPQADLAAQRS